MRKNLTLFLVAITLISCGSETKKQKNQFNGDVKEMKESKYSASDKFGEPTIEELISAMKYEYGIFENEIRNNLYDDENKLTSVAKIEYNKENKKIKSCLYSNTGELIWRTEYDKNGNITKIEESDSGEMILRNRLEHEYSKNEDILKIQVYDAKGENTSIITFKYNDNKVIERYIHDNEMKLTMQISYNKEEDVIKEQTYGDDGNITNKLLTDYNKNGDVIKRHEYDGNKNLITETTYEYSKFDKNDNWIEKITYVDGKVKFIETREFTYR